MLDLAEVLVESALARQESRGAPFPRGLSQTRRPQLAETHAGISSHKGVEFKYKPVDHYEVPAEGAEILKNRFIGSSVHRAI